MIQILDAAAEEQIRGLELKRLELKHSDPMDREIQSWNAPWRSESLAHYLATGWSVGVFDPEGRLRGYFLAQPLLFFRGLTQVLWVEHMLYQNQDDFEVLIDTATRYAKEKHLQSVYYPDASGTEREVRTTKRH